MAYKFRDEELKQLGPLLGVGGKGEASGGALLAMSDMLAARREKPERLLPQAFDNAFSRMFYPEESGGDQVGQKKGMGDAGIGATPEIVPTPKENIQTWWDNNVWGADAVHNAQTAEERQQAVNQIVGQRRNELQGLYGQLHGNENDAEIALNNDLKFTLGAIGGQNAAGAYNPNPLGIAGQNGGSMATENNSRQVVKTYDASIPKPFSLGTEIITDATEELAKKGQGFGKVQPDEVKIISKIGKNIVGPLVDIGDVGAFYRNTAQEFGQHYTKEAAEEIARNAAGYYGLGYKPLAKVGKIGLAATGTAVAGPGAGTGLGLAAGYMADEYLSDIAKDYAKRLARDEYLARQQPSVPQKPVNYMPGRTR